MAGTQSLGVDASRGRPDGNLDRAAIPNRRCTRIVASEPPRACPARRPAWRGGASPGLLAWLTILVSVGLGTAIVAVAIAHQRALMMAFPDFDSVIVAYYYGNRVRLFILGAPIFLISLATFSYPYRRPVGGLPNREPPGRIPERIGHPLPGGWNTPPLNCNPAISRNRDRERPNHLRGQSVRWREVNDITCCRKEGVKYHFVYVDLILKPELGPPMSCDVAGSVTEELRPIAEETISPADPIRLGARAVTRICQGSVRGSHF